MLGNPFTIFFYFYYLNGISFVCCANNFCRIFRFLIGFRIAELLIADFILWGLIS